MCGIVGIVGSENLNQELYDGLTVLQHRGQDAAGIVTYDNDRVYQCKGNGLVRDVFQESQMQRLQGEMGIAHVRYPTAGSSSSAEAQPFYVNSPYGLCLSHNGNLVNAEKLKQELYVDDRRHINTNSDSEILLNVLAHELLRCGRLQLSHEDIFNAVKGVHKRCQGAYAVVVMICGVGILAFRDPHGIRPLVYGVKDTPSGKQYMLASESVALDTQGYELISDVKPGEAVLVDRDKQLHHQQCAEQSTYAPCIFEYVYFARPDSVLENVYVQKARMRMGLALARKILSEWPHHDIDVVIPIPDTSRTAALEIAHVLGVKYREGFIKNRYIGRTFIMPGQTQRKKSVRQKLNPIKLEYKDKNVLLVDDSIVRGTTSKEIVQMARDAGAKKVYLASASPPVRYQNVYGIDMPAAAELIAHGKDISQICAEIGADKLFYQELEDLFWSVQKGNEELTQFEASVFTGEYITGIDDNYLQSLEEIRNDASKVQQTDDYTSVDVINNVK
ncbi:MAG: amidophosphoribosyltransferase [Gammaproteobacteria bacterium TMED119]|nr:MAG: amidophosphoribosyltransferase [Gammaproteobacteria bacterium TMED119]RCL46041.1 MAG: amidophosphoribosyltransferase [Candidatus Thioglobus sp.]|tara:strand:- start:245 stop:1753 length:1509 start_codon:yes stop_codon:yes gene_type:complete